MDTITKANKTCRTNGAVGKNAIIPRLVAAFIESFRAIPKDFTVLDFGAGTNAIHAKALEKQFPDIIVDAYDFGDNSNENHIREIKTHKYDLIYASNVFNTHSNLQMSLDALASIFWGLKQGGTFIVNLPESPRYFHDNKTFNNILNQYFSTVNKGEKKNTWVCIK